MVAMIFFNGLSPELGMAKIEILFYSEISSLEEAFSRVFRVN